MTGFSLSANLGLFRCSVLLLATALLLAGCATRPSLPPITGEQQLKALTTWRVEGKLGFRSPEKNGSAWIDWSQQDRAYELHLNGPFGAAATRIEGNDYYAILSQAGQQDTHAGSGEELTEWLFGWTFPVIQMSSWIKGLPAKKPKPGNITTTTGGLLESMEQKGWQLTYSDYHQEGDWVLPGRIKGSQGNYAFTLVIKKWHLPAASNP